MPPNEIPPGARRRPTPYGYTFWILGEERAILRDAYHTFLRLRWSSSLGLIGVGLLLINLAFACVFYVVGGVKGGDDSFFSMFSFSVQTMATIGYGVMHPAGRTAELAMIFEAVVGIIIVALATGLVFSKFARATARVAFSRHAVISEHEGKRTLMFRIGNLRSNILVEATIHATAALSVTTKEGRPFYRMSDLTLVRDRMAGLRRGWTVMHVIDEASPLFGHDAKSLAEAECEIELSLMGLDDVTMQTVHAIHVYSDADLKLGYRLVDMLRPLPSGDVVVDLTRFHAIEPAPAGDGGASR